MSAALRTSRRSWLFTPATRPDRFANAAKVGADVLILDLEDAVAPGDKEQARATALAYLAAGSASGWCALRINGLRTRAGISDVQALLQGGAAPDAVILPKVESPTEPCLVDAWLA